MTAALPLRPMTAALPARPRVQAPPAVQPPAPVSASVRSAAEIVEHLVDVLDWDPIQDGPDRVATTLLGRGERGLGCFLNELLISVSGNRSSLPGVHDNPYIFTHDLKAALKLVHTALMASFGGIDIFTFDVLYEACRYHWEATSEPYFDETDFTHLDLQSLIV